MTAPPPDFGPRLGELLAAIGRFNLALADGRTPDEAMEAVHDLHPWAARTKSFQKAARMLAANHEARIGGGS